MRGLRGTFIAMSLMDRRGDYSWPKTAIADVSIILDKGVVSLEEDVGITVGFRVVGGLRESFTPNVWTMSWEDNDKLVRLMMDISRLVRQEAREHREGGQEGEVLLEQGP